MLIVETHEAHPWPDPLDWEGRGAEGIAYAKRLTRAALDRPVADGLADERRGFSEVMRTASA